MSIDPASVDFPEVTNICDLPDVAAGNSTWILCKSSVQLQLWSRLSSPENENIFMYYVFCRGQRTPARSQFLSSTVWVRAQTQVIRLGGEHLNPLGWPSQPLSCNPVGRRKTLSRASPKNIGKHRCLRYE